MDINWKRNTALFLTGQALSIFGSMVVQYAILWHITLKTQSGTMMAIISFALFLPMFLISPFAGVWADRFNRKYIINISDGAIAFASLIVTVLVFFGIDNFGILLCCAVIRSFGQGVQMPAVGALIPQIVPQESLTKINGFQSSIQSLTMLTAPMISGALMSFAPLEVLFFLDVITAAIGISILFFFVKTPPMEKAETESRTKGIEYFKDLKAGLNYIKRNNYILWLFVFSALFLIFAAPSAFLSGLQVTRDFGNDVWRLTAIEITFSIGMMIGGVLIGMWGGFKNRIFTMVFATVLYGFGVISLGLADNFWVYTGIMAVIGITMPLYSTPAMVLVQTTVESVFMGRVMSVFTMVQSVMMPLGMLVFGPVADMINIDFLMIGTGAVIALTSIPFIANKALREAGKPV
ncbi:MAG: MFS transporter [Treponema sp.]|jgi:DHA3 family macrolide efflux protein-like MFS transporter|nr:MFS transporter [Treponema sp.]